MSSHGAYWTAQSGQPGSAGQLGYSPLVSGEAVQIDLRVARIGSRAVAAFLDLVLQFIAMIFVSALLANVINLDEAARRAIAIIAVVLILIGYPVIIEAAWDGRTLGKAAMGLRAARDDGGPLRFRHALVRGLVGVFVEKPGITLGLAAVISSMLSTRGKRLGDFFAGTVVLQVRLPSSGAYVPAMPPPLAQWASTLDLSRFNDTLALQCRQFLGRAGQLTWDSRERLGASLVASVQAVIIAPPPPGTPGWAYLSAVLAERRRREEMRLYGAANPPQPHHPPPPAGYPPPPVGYVPQNAYARPVGLTKAGPPEYDQVSAPPPNPPDPFAPPS